MNDDLSKALDRVLQSVASVKSVEETDNPRKEVSPAEVFAMYAAELQLEVWRSELAEDLGKLKRGGS